MFDDLAGFNDNDEDTVFQPVCELPSAFANRTRFMTGEEIDDLPNENELKKCQICLITDPSTNRTKLPPCISEFKAAFESQSNQLPESEACVALSVLFNKTCYQSDHVRIPNERAGVTKMTPRHVQLHFNHTAHLRVNEERMISNKIWYANQLISFVLH